MNYTYGIHAWLAFLSLRPVSKYLISKGQLELSWVSLRGYFSVIRIKGFQKLDPKLHPKLKLTAYGPQATLHLSLWCLKLKNLPEEFCTSRQHNYKPLISLSSLHLGNGRAYLIDLSYQLFSYYLMCKYRGMCVHRQGYVYVYGGLRTALHVVSELSCTSLRWSLITAWSLPRGLGGLWGRPAALTVSITLVLMLQTLTTPGF